MYYANRATVVSALLLGYLRAIANGDPTLASRASVLSGPDVADKAYDFIVVGGGTAGLTVADRLSEDPNTTVLVIEHGYFSDVNDPALDPTKAFVPSRYYNITSAPQPELGNKTFLVLPGHCVGGSSAVNGKAIMRGTAREHDIWAELGGPNSTWNWEGILPYYKKAIYFNEPDPAYAAEFNITYDLEGAWGQDNSTRLISHYSPYLPDLLKVRYKALTKVPGIEIPKDGAAGTHGLFWYPISMDENAVNWSYSRTAHWDGLNRPNYDLIVGHRVNKVLFDGNTAVGVQFVDHDGVTNSVMVSAKKEGVLSAGALHSPHILMLSGIGPEKTLKDAGVEVKLDLPGVGQNLQDHPNGPNVTYQYGIQPPANATPELDLWRVQGLVAALNLPVLAPDAYKDISEQYASQNLEDYLPPTHPTVLAGLKKQQAIYAEAMLSKNVSFLNYLIGGQPAGSTINFHVMSRGFVALNTTHPEAEPIVDIRALSNPVDIALQIAFLRFHRTHFSRDYKEWNVTEMYPGPEVSTDAEWEELIRDQYQPFVGHHFVGTTAKAPREDGGVVDEELRVYGTKGLRVVDAGIIPTLVGAATQFTVYGVAEKAADMIKTSWA